MQGTGTKRKLIDIVPLHLPLQLVIKFGSYVAMSTLLDLAESWTTRSWDLFASLSVSIPSLSG
jgi:hypothetical protein